MNLARECRQTDKADDKIQYRNVTSVVPQTVGLRYLFDWSTLFLGPEDPVLLDRVMKVLLHTIRQRRASQILCFQKSLRSGFNRSSDAALQACTASLQANNLFERQS